uniref:Lipase domain-containing protein n=1 Tax=Heliothis virescens TaxID=7102 RepID=A0A2A4IV85_HELVI
MARVRALAQAACLAIILLAQGTISQRHPIKEALLLHTDAYGNATFEDCVWRKEKEVCPDPDVNLHLYTEADPLKNVVDLSSQDWLRQSGWDPAHENVLLIHGYAGGDDTLPIVVLRDAYLRRGGYNVFMLDWGTLCQPPCYVAAVHNLRPVARCVAEALGALRRAGLRTDNLTCVGHSLGAHLCGIIANYLTFRLNRIIGLDPARPLIRSAPALRLDPGDARAVHVLHTNAGRYGEAARLGHADFCLNGGRSQPYCEDTPTGHEAARHEALGEEFTISILGINGFFHYDAEAWVRSMGLEPVEPLLEGLLPDHGYIVDFDGRPRIFANALGLVHIYRCPLLLEALEEVDFFEDAPAGGGNSSMMRRAGLLFEDVPGGVVILRCCASRAVIFRE